MIRSTFAAALALALGALSIAAHPASQDPDGAPEHRSAPEVRPTETVFVVRYDPSSIHLTEELVAALCRSSVTFVVPEEGIEGLTPGEAYGLDVTALPGWERQPPGVFVGSASLTGAAAEAPEATWTRVFDSLLARLGDALERRLVARPRARLMESLHAGKDELSHWREKSLALDLQAAEFESERLRVDRVESLRRDIEGHKLERAVASDAWREALANLAKAEAEFVAAKTKAQEDARRVQLLELKLVSPLPGMTFEEDTALTRERLELAESQRNTLASNLERATDETKKRAAQLAHHADRLRDSEARLEALTAEPTSHPGSDAEELAQAIVRFRLEAAQANRRAERLEARVAEIEDELAQLREVTIERW
jgi:hypothetical protein